MAHSISSPPYPSDSKYSSPDSQPEEESYIDYYYDDPEDLPGELDLEPDALPPEIAVIHYNETDVERVKVSSPSECIPYLRSDEICWVNVLGLGNEATWKEMAKVFKIHPLALGDVVNVPQRPKIVQYDEQLVIIIWMFSVNEEPDDPEDRLDYEQVSFILGHNYLITVQENPGHDCLKPVRERIRNNQGVIRKKGLDYLAYSLVDTIIDGFFPVLEEYGELIDDLEDEVVFRPRRRTLRDIYSLRRELLTLRRAIWSQREAINILIRDGAQFIQPDVQVYFRDCYEHTIQIRDIVETYRDLASALMDIYLSSISNRMNEVMKFLTVISSIFIPLTFIAGVYGMNFDHSVSPFNMPELDWYYGYPLCLLVMLLISLALVYFFWRQGWFKTLSASVSDDFYEKHHDLKARSRR